MATKFERVRLSRDRGRLISLLTNDEWPFHGRRVVDADAVDGIDFSGSDVESYWIVDDDTVGLLRLFDLDDIGQGAPQFDLRIVSEHRNRGYGAHATKWLVTHLFDAYPELHRIEANTRGDNTAMQRALSTAGFTQEGRLRSSWWSEDDTRFDTLVYGILRTDRRDVHESRLRAPSGNSEERRPARLDVGRHHEVQIRELVPGGGEPLVALFASVLPDSPAALVDELGEPEAFLREPNTFALGAYVDDAAVGLAWGMQMRSPSGRLTTYLHELDVHEDWRRQGIGSSLVTEAMTVARRNGSTKFWLSTGGHNERAQALYGSLGGDRKPLGDVNYWWELD